MITKIKKASKRTMLLFIYIVFTIIVGVYVFVAAPNLSPLYADGAFFWLVLISAYSLIPLLSTLKLEQYTDEAGHVGVRVPKGKMPKKAIIIILASLWGLYLVVNILFTPLFFWKTYRDQLSQPVVKEFTADVAPIDLNQIPIVDKSLARDLADKKLGEKPSLGSQVTLGEPTIQNVDGELVWAVPLLHSGFFKWLANIEGSAGYIKVSATNLKNIEYVDTYKIKIQPVSYFMDDLDRRVRFGGGLFKGITDYSFELDNTGKPYWVVTTYKNLRGFTLPEADGVIIVDAQTGASQRYTLANVPEWVDRIQPEEFIAKQIDNQGQYVHGVFNFSNKEKFKASEGENIVYNNGRCYYFTGITSVGVDQSATGFMMVDMVTKEPTLYRMSGATERSAMDSAQGKVQDLGYYATAPIIINVFDEPTYFMTLKDSANLIKKYAFVSIKDYMVVGVGDTMSEAKADYAKATNDLSDKPSFGTEGQVELTAVGTIDRINFTINDGVTVYSFTVDDKPGVIFTANLALSSKLPLTQKGDSVQLKYVLVEDKLMETIEFNNITI